MSTLFAVYNLKEKKMTGEYDKYIIETKILEIKGAPRYTEFHIWRIVNVLAHAVSEPKGKLSEEPLHMYLAKIEGSDLDAMVSFLDIQEGKDFIKSWSVFVDPKAILTRGQEI